MGNFFWNSLFTLKIFKISVFLIFQNPIHRKKLKSFSKKKLKDIWHKKFLNYGATSFHLILSGESLGGKRKALAGSYSNSCADSVAFLKSYKSL